MEAFPGESGGLEGVLEVLLEDELCPDKLRCLIFDGFPDFSASSSGK